MDPKLTEASNSEEKLQYHIRGYRSSDRRRVRHICCQTGFLGEPQEPVFIGREIFADLFSGYYTDYEPQHALVAVVNERVQGYLLGCLDTRKQKRVFRRKILPRVILCMLDPRWLRHSVNLRFSLAMRKSSRREEFSFPDEAAMDEHPAHLHINIADPVFRGRGIGRSLISTFLDILRSAGIRGVHLCTTSHNRSAVRFYSRMGFEILHKSRLTCYDHVIDDPPLYTICYGMKL